MADVAANLKSWSATESSNAPSGATAVGTGLDDNLRAIQAVVRQDLATKGADIASASTTDLGAVAGLMHDITGTTSITSFGTVSAGIWKFIKFEGALTLTHNATSLILPGGESITTADGDTAVVISEGSGNWRCLSYTRAGGLINADIPAFSSALLVHDVTSGTGGGTTTATTWTKRTLAESLDADGIVSVSSSVFTLGAGTYEISAWQSFSGPSNTALLATSRIRNTSDGTTTAVGGAVRIDAATGETQGIQISIPSTRFTISGSKNFELQYYISAAVATNGLGYPSSSGENERYAWVYIRKVA